MLNFAFQAMDSEGISYRAQFTMNFVVVWRHSHILYLCMCKNNILIKNDLY